jgi:hypothetical protein
LQERQAWIWTEEHAWDEAEQHPKGKGEKGNKKKKKKKKGNKEL